MEAPKQIRPKESADYLEVMTKAVFQSGISWRVIEAKWDGFREAFHGFDPGWVASLEEPDVDRLAADTRIVRNRRKIEATVHNARTIVELDREHGGFRSICGPTVGSRKPWPTCGGASVPGRSRRLLLPVRGPRGGAAPRGMDGGARKLDGPPASPATPLIEGPVGQASGGELLREQHPVPGDGEHRGPLPHGDPLHLGKVILVETE